jgi:hypothetical protein
MRSALLDGDSHNYDMERGYTRHAINESGDHGILIKLGTQAIINHIKMLLWDRDLRYRKHLYVKYTLLLLLFTKSIVLRPDFRTVVAYCGDRILDNGFNFCPAQMFLISIAHSRPIHA